MLIRLNAVISLRTGKNGKAMAPATTATPTPTNSTIQPTLAFTCCNGEERLYAAEEDANDGTSKKNP